MAINEMEYPLSAAKKSCRGPGLLGQRLRPPLWPCGILRRFSTHLTRAALRDIPLRLSKRRFCCNIVIHGLSLILPFTQRKTHTH